MNFVTLIAVLAGIVTITGGGGIVGFLRYLRARPREGMSPHFLNLNLARQYQLAIESCQEALRKNPQDDHAYVNLSWAFNMQKEYAQALEASDHAINLKESAPAYTNRGWALHECERYSLALHAHERALALDPNYAPAYKGKGDALQKLGRIQEAQQAYEKARQLEQ